MNVSEASDRSGGTMIEQQHCETPVRPKTLNGVEGHDGQEEEMGSEEEDAEAAEREHEEKCKEAK